MNIMTGGLLNTSQLMRYGDDLLQVCISNVGGQFEVGGKARTPLSGFHVSPGGGAVCTPYVKTVVLDMKQGNLAQGMPLDFAPLQNDLFVGLIDKEGKKKFVRAAHVYIDKNGAPVSRCGDYAVEGLEPVGEDRNLAWKADGTLYDKDTHTEYGRLHFYRFPHTELEVAADGTYMMKAGPEGGGEPNEVATAEGEVYIAPAHTEESNVNALFQALLARSIFLMQTIASAIQSAALETLNQLIKDVKQ